MYTTIFLCVSLVLLWGKLYFTAAPTFQMSQNLLWSHKKHIVQCHKIKHNYDGRFMRALLHQYST